MKTRSQRILNVFSLALIAMGLLGFIYPLAANIYDWFHQSAVIKQAQSQWEGLSAAEVSQEFALAKRYNEQLAAASVGTTVTTDGERENTATFRYGRTPPVLYKDVFRNFLVFATVSVPSVGIDELPVRHGISDIVLQQGIGHLPNTSYPVGGVSTHTVVTAHSGLINHPYFTNLPKVAVGDYFYFNTLGRQFAYRVISVKTIEPTDTDTIAIVPGKDQASLFTCVPVGINTHRLLVTGVRADADKPADRGWLCPLLVLLALLLLLLWLLLRCSRCRIVLVQEGEIGVGAAGEVWVSEAWAGETGTGERSESRVATYVEGRLHFALHTGDKLLVLSRGGKDKSRTENGIESGVESGVASGVKHTGDVVQMFALNETDGDGADGAGVGGAANNSSAAGEDSWSEVTYAKAKTLVRFEVQNLNVYGLPHDTPVRVRRQRTLSTR